ncbi:hypothetical protein [Sharpea azabuensis]|uniref:hypothetical protein n=1 Tax=Sharpea azabuensis TaxID=322505 RepID=UPI001569700E|nr:hypothetical protein [Sharpea azabuensis]
MYRDLHWRFFDKEPIFTIVNTNAEANIPSQSILDDDFYNITSTELRITSDIVENKLDYIGEDNYVYKWDRELGEYVKSDIYVKGDTGDQGPIGPRGYMGLRGPEGESAYQVALDNGFVGTEQQWLDSLKADATQEIAAVNARVDNLAARIHVGQFNANDITEEGWYDSVVLGRPVGSESDEKYFLYMSSNGGQVCFSRRNSGKVYHRLGLGHKWVAVTHDDYGRSEANASSLKVYPVNEEY